MRGSGWWVVVGLSVALAAPTGAVAQEGSSPPDAPPSEAPPSEAPPSEAPPPEAPPPDRPAGEEDPRFAEARRRFRQGVALARAGNCPGAIAELNASLELVPRANTLYNIAQCQEELHRYDLAVASYGRYLELAPEDEPERAAVRATMRALANLLGTITIASSVPAEVWLDDRVVGQAPGDVLVPGGHHVLELRAEGYLPERREVEVAARRTVTLQVTLTRAEENVTIHRTTQIERPPLPSGVFFGGVGITLLAAGVGAYFGVTALVLSDQASGRPDPRLPVDTGQIAESAGVADAFFVAAGLFAVASLIVAFLTDFEGDADDAEEGPRIGPAGVEVLF